MQNRSDLSPAEKPIRQLDPDFVSIYQLYFGSRGSLAVRLAAVDPTEVRRQRFFLGRVSKNERSDANLI